MRVRHHNSPPQTPLAQTNEEKARIFLRTFFCPAPDKTSLNIPRKPTYPKPKFTTPQISHTQLHRQIKRLGPFKAPGPDGIPNAVYQQCADILVPRLIPLFQASLRIPHYPTEWKTSRTIVLRKPGRPDYTTSKAYRPIALLNTDAKLLSACIAETITYHSLDKHMLPPNHFGGLPGRTTTDAIHYITAKIKQAQRRQKTAAILFLDIQAAFPSTSIDRLIHNLRMAGIPRAYTDWLRAKTQNRQTTLAFDDYNSNPETINHGLDQGCPLSPILYLYYNAGLLESTEGQKEDSVAFIDDAAVMAFEDSPTQAIERITDIYTRPGGVQKWCSSHASISEISKAACMIFSTRKQGSPDTKINILGNDILLVTEHKYLGFLLDNRLTGRAQANAAIGKGTRAAGQIRRLAKTTGGIPATHLRTLYNTVVIPKTLYAADCFIRPFTTQEDRPIHNTTSQTTAPQKRSKGSVGFAKRLRTIQRTMTTAITGALRTTPTEILDYNAGLLPAHLLINKLCHRSALRMLSLPNTHPLFHLVRKANRSQGKRLPSQLHHLNRVFKLTDENPEQINSNPKNPNKEPVIKTHIDNSRRAAIQFARHTKHNTQIFTDGSSRPEGVGAAAVLIRGNRTKTLAFYLGSPHRHTVYEAELTGLVLGTHLLLQEQRLTTVQIATDNQAAIKAIQQRKPHAGHHLVQTLEKQLLQLQVKYRRLRIDLTWTPGHEGILGNEIADRAANKATCKQELALPEEYPTALQKLLPSNTAALKQTYHKSLQKRALQHWKTSPRSTKLFQNFPLTMFPGKQHIQKVFNLPRWHASLLIQMRAGHAPLNAYLSRIKRADSPSCPACLSNPETVNHFLVTCSKYEHLRGELRRLSPRFAGSTKHLLSAPLLYPALFRYIDNTERFPT